MKEAYKIFTQAIRNGWQPKIDGDEIGIRPDAQLTWFPTHKMIVVPSDKGTVELDSEDLIEAKKYNEEIYG